jgi:hypothetical protein
LGPYRLVHLHRFPIGMDPHLPEIHPEAGLHKGTYRLRQGTAAALAQTQLRFDRSSRFKTPRLRPCLVGVEALLRGLPYRSLLRRSPHLAHWHGLEWLIRLFVRHEHTRQRRSRRAQHLARHALRFLLVLVPGRPHHQLGLYHPPAVRPWQPLGLHEPRHLPIPQDALQLQHWMLTPWG